MASNDPDLPDPSADPQPGDLIEIFRPAYQHWALYLGDGYIINLTPVGERQLMPTDSVNLIIPDNGSQIRWELLDQYDMFISAARLQKCIYSLMQHLVPFHGCSCFLQMKALQLLCPV